MLKTVYHRSVVSLKHFYYRERGEPITYGSHHLRFIPGTRPVRLKYIDSANGTVRNDARQIKFFLDQIEPASLVFDIGGHVGQYAVLFASLVTDSGRVVTFEPDASSRALLHENLSLNGFQSRVQVEDLALFDSAGTRPFFSKGNGDANAALINAHAGAGNDVRERLVKTESLDDYLDSRQLRCPNWIKLDTEGAEIDILRGARKTLKAGAKVACELHPYAWPEFGTTFQELLDIVSDCGRTIRYLDDSLSIKDGARYGAALIL